jgi:hypothetical protein
MDQKTVDCDAIDKKFSDGFWGFLSALKDNLRSLEENCEG